MPTVGVMWVVVPDGPETRDQVHGFSGRPTGSTLLYGSGPGLSSLVPNSGYLVWTH